MDINIIDDLDDIMDDINTIYDDLENEYEAYFKTRQIVLYKPLDYTIIIYLNCISYILQYISII
jgi:hypothetical protein